MPGTSHGLGIVESVWTSGDGEQGSIHLFSMHTSPLAQPGHGNAGGMNVYISYLSRALVARGYRIEAFTLATDPLQVPDAHRADPGTEASTSTEVIPGYTVHTLYLPEAFGADKNELARLTEPFGRACARFAAARHLVPDAVHAHYWLSGEAARVYLSTMSAAVPLVLTLHTTALVKNAHSGPGEPQEPESRAEAERRLIAEADAVVVNTRHEADQMREFYDADADTLRIIPPGVDTHVFRPPEQPVDRAATGGDDFTVVFAGRPQPLKGPEILIEAVARAADDVPGIRLEIRGTASEEYIDSLRDLARENGILERCRFVPASGRAELAEAFRRSDAVACPSSSETFGLVALEAQACGVPVLASDVSGLRVALDGGDSGILVGSRTPQAWARQLIRLAHDPGLRQQLSAAGLRHAGTLTWDRAAALTGDLYRQLSESAARPSARGHDEGEE